MSQTAAIDKKNRQPFTKREWEIVKLVAKGLKNKEIAENLNLSEGTIKVNCVNIFRKINAKNRTELAAYYFSRFKQTDPN